MPDTADTPRLDRAGGGREDRRLTTARRLVTGTFAFMVLQIPFFAVIGAVNSLQLDGSVPLWRNVLGILLALPLAWLVMMIVRHRLGAHPLRDPDRVFWASFALLAAVVVCLDVYTWTMLVAGSWWSVTALVGTRWRMASVAAVLIGASWLRIAVLAEPDFALLALAWAFPIVWTLIVLAGNYATLLLWDIASTAHGARDARARLAVSEERLRFARDMHDLLGHSLSGIAVKSELAARLAERDPGRAAREMGEVQRVAREALREVRAAVTGYREIDLEAEVAGVRAVLQAAGVRCSADLPDTAALPAELRTLAAWVVREGGTNVLRHSTARSFEIALRAGERAVVLEVFNDGAPPAADGTAPRYGNGLNGLAERVAAAGGSLSAAATGGGGFLLRAVLPYPAAPAAPEPLPPSGGRKDVTV
ncbi:sensor histidine kinase [Nocardiopsis trehalosi]|jgi:two-component system sensor histidine kinase DesK|uniref:sensor histidine kinase n=1 Tax=Nocardiopsis trehalosi TaxID=109329 RepID=UPI00082BCAAF|nr:histidine kinase [Nocardiopsis trehalosi]